MILYNFTGLISFLSIPVLLKIFSKGGDGGDDKKDRRQYERGSGGGGGRGKK